MFENIHNGDGWNIAGFFTGCYIQIMAFFNINAVGITAFFMVISVIGGLFLKWQENQIKKQHNQALENRTKPK